MKFQPKWTADQVETVFELVESAPSRARGYRIAAEVLGTTEKAIIGIIRRHTHGSAPSDAPPRAPKGALDGYVEALEEKTERARVKTLEKDLYSIRKSMEAMSALTSRPLPQIQRHELSSGVREGAAVAMLSDVHVEEEVRLGETPVANEYTPEIADRSIARFFAGYRWLLDFHRNAFQIRDAVLWLGGDLMSGHIHEELKETTDKAPIETLLWLRPRLMAGIDLLLEDPKIETLHIPCSYGNHGRNTMKPYRAKGAAHSYEWLLYQWLASAYEGNPRVKFLADQSAHQYMQVFDWNLHFHHGDETSYQGGVGGITIPLNKAIAQWDIAKKCDYHHFGHWHQYIDTGPMVVNGSVIGFNAYAMSIKARPEVPQQAFYVLDSKRGKTCKSPIWVRESAK